MPRPHQPIDSTAHDLIYHHPHDAYLFNRTLKKQKAILAAQELKNKQQRISLCGPPAGRRLQQRLPKLATTWPADPSSSYLKYAFDQTMCRARCKWGVKELTATYSEATF